MPESVERFSRHLYVIAFLLVLLGGALLYTRALTTNPAGFYIDESSIAYNAQLIAQTGRDEHGESWPLYFRAFGDYKNPVYVYLLAAIFRVTGPGIGVARLFSVMLGVLAAGLMGLLAFRITQQRAIGLLLTFIAFFTPWLFELSRVVVEVALYPLLVAAFLLLVQRVCDRRRWTWADETSLALVLGLLTYAYSIGRLLGPLLALGLLILWSRVQISSILKTWLWYAVALVPLLLYQLHHPGALSARYQLLTYITPQTTWAADLGEFIRHYLGNINPWKMIGSGDPNGFQIASVYGAGPVLLVELILVAASILLLARARRFDSWWRLVVYALAVSFVPASLTKDYFHTLRLAAVPVLLLALTIPAFAWMLERNTSARRAVLIVTVALVLGQGLFFQWQYHAAGKLTRRLNLFDSDYASIILPAAMAASGGKPIYLADAPPIPGYIQAFWYATIERIPRERFVLLAADASAPDQAAVISTEDTCPRCDVIFKRWPYTVYVAKGPARVLAPLPAELFRAEIRAIDCPSHLRTSQPAMIRVALRNASVSVWPARERAVASFQINVGNHWLDSSGQTVVNDDGRATLLQDLLPGQEAEFSFTINAPSSPGQYILEIDALQENVSWFGLKGSKTLRLPVKVE